MQTPNDSIAPALMEYYDSKLRYKNLKNEVHFLGKKNKVARKKDASVSEVEAIANVLDSRKRELDQAKNFYKERRNTRWKNMFHRSD